MQIVIDHLIGKVEPLRGKSNDQEGMSINSKGKLNGVAVITPMVQKGWLSHPHLDGMWVASHLHSHGVGSATPKGPNGGGQNHPQTF
jgi:hypothetical protein